ncbi:MAG: flagellar motor stator protein MotA [Candidatus Schekmanbacteria bacterium]|nr:MAG: flagellar motor stator protein MotA [Candidatus Schekmanbacteria bacterium]
MFAIIGIVVVIGSIISGYLLEHGNLSVLIQPAELIIIGGAALGSLIVTCPPSILSDIVKKIPTVFKGSAYDKKAYLELLNLLYDIFVKIRKEGVLHIESDIEAPDKSELFKKYPSVLSNHHALKFLCDNLRVYIVGVKPSDLEDMMDVELETHHAEAETSPSIITKVGDSLPGFGIVAAVLGVVITMGKMDESPEVIGHSVAAALVGTFLGILLCYGIVGPIGSHLELKAKEESKYLEVIKCSILAFAKEVPPQMAVEYGRRVLYSDTKPSFKELEEKVRKKKAA